MRLRSRESSKNGSQQTKEERTKDRHLDQCCWAEHDEVWAVTIWCGQVRIRSESQRNIKKLASKDQREARQWLELMRDWEWEGLTHLSAVAADGVGEEGTERGQCNETWRTRPRRSLVWAQRSSSKLVMSTYGDPASPPMAVSWKSRAHHWPSK